MKLGFVTTHLPPDQHFGGVVGCGHHLSRCLRPRLERCTVACVSADPARVLSGANPPEICARSRMFHRWGFAPSWPRRIKPLLAGTELLHVNGVITWPVTTAALMAARRGLPYVVSPHGAYRHEWRYAAWRHRLFNGAFGRRVLQGAACVHATAEDEVEGFRRMGYAGPVAVVPNGIEPSEFAALPDRGEAERKWPALRGRRVALFLSRVAESKGLDQLIPAWSAVRRRHPDTALVLAGPDEHGYLATVQRLIAREQLGDSVLLPGMLGGEERLALFSRSDVFVLPSYSENFSLSVAEALACGIPVVTTTGTPWKVLEQIGAGRWVPPEANALAEALAGLLALPEAERRAMGERGRKLVLENYTWDIAARKMLTVYRCIRQGNEIPQQPEPADV